MCGLDNREMVDDGTAQALKESDILKLRARAPGQVRLISSAPAIIASGVCTGGCGDYSGTQHFVQSQD